MQFTCINVFPSFTGVVRMLLTTPVNHRWETLLFSIKLLYI